MSLDVKKHDFQVKINLVSVDKLSEGVENIKIFMESLS